ncbi:DUF2333 family protein [Teredinibacter sp. KSP-S5-2]|uniref:DUF2333 family protein n=1 Tax=Teredinibacter sp. KSP-S5-2 TaxID=3034506 RepID=UPI002935315B|nr:DUF2333 family protein [Teredinibacter sp. KSP-S5-2]WNO08555.1 DUF2333 family protein [Teredinibacter sp. KSP-S5-2]
MLKKVSGSVDGIKKFAETRWLDFRGDINESNRWVKIGLTALVVYFVIAVAVGFYWNFEPDQFAVREYALTQVSQDETQLVTGVITTSSLVGVVDTMLHKRGGYLSNDIAPPGVWMDNVPNWEYGVLIQVRDLTKAMREAFSRSQSQSTEDKDLALAESRFNFDNKSWLLPQTEGEYREGMVFIQKYIQRLADKEEHNAQFYARADNLNYWLRTVETRLGSLSQRLSASVGQRRLNTDLAGDTAAQQATRAPKEMDIKTPWSKIDDVFYEARGSAWALIHFLKAIEKDFADVLEKKNARVSLQQIIRELEATQQPVYSPMILNGSGFGMLANHSLVMASYISRANAAIIDLRELLQQG